MKVVDAEKLIEVIRSGDFGKKGELHRLILQLAVDIPEISVEKLEGFLPDNEQLDMTNVWYSDPTLVWFLDSKHTKKRGLVFHEYLIDLTTGRAYTCQEILRRAQNMGIDLDDAIIERSWYN